MKTTHNSPDKLILDYTPWIMGGIFATLILLSAGGAMYSLGTGETTGFFVGLGGVIFCGLFFVVFVRRVQLVLERTSGTATLRRRDVLRDVKEQFKLADVLRAEVQRTTSSDGEGTATETSRAALIVTGQPEPVPLTIVYSSGSGGDRAADAINAWLAKG